MDDKQLVTDKEIYVMHPLIDRKWVEARESLPSPFMRYKDEFSRINRFLNWLDHCEIHWTGAKLADYRDYLIEQGLSQKSIGSILPTIRNSYRRALRDNELLEDLLMMCSRDVVDGGPADIKALFDLIIQRMENNIDPLNSPVHEIKVGDEADSSHVWLTMGQVDELLSLPDRSTLKGFRDLLILSLLSGLGLRESELCDLRMKDIAVMFGGELALQVSLGKGRKKRLVPYGEQRWIVDLICEWVNKANLPGADDELIIIRGLHSSGKYVRDNKMSTRSVQKIVSMYRPGNGSIKVTPHDLRRTYARLLYLSGIDLERISQNMGHGSIETTRGYIGTLSVSERSPGLLFNNPL